MRGVIRAHLEEEHSRQGEKQTQTSQGGTWAQNLDLPEAWLSVFPSRIWSRREGPYVKNKMN